MSELLLRWACILGLFSTAFCFALGCDNDDDQFSHCNNLMRDGPETDIDCGGDCEPCADGSSCDEGDDCESGNCDLRVCRPSGVSCSDTVTNGEETDVDCGGSHCEPCADDLACSEPTDCISGVCIGRICRSPSCGDSMLNGEETDIDCGGTECLGCGIGSPCVVGTDCQSGECGVATGVCEEPSCTDNRRNGWESDIDCGGGVCAQCATGENCLVHEDCVSLNCNDSGACVQASCSDGVRNQDETGIDCGGEVEDGGEGCVARCEDEESCLVADDCLSGVCSGDPLTCQEPTCEDGVKNADEADIDCGSTDGCDPCADSLSCEIPGDCASGVCLGDPRTCQEATCEDGVENPNTDESDIDCGGFDCVACADGLGCELPRDCVSGVCSGDPRSCTAPTCEDLVQNQTETDVDCGGTDDCDPCVAGSDCLSDTDCVSLNCAIPVDADPPIGSCVDASCTDGVHNNDETDVDCGGPDCPSCGDGLLCDDEDDCISLVCNPSHRCAAATCGDEVLNQTETDIDCGGTDGCDPCLVDEMCEINDDCEDSAYCQAFECRRALSCLDLMAHRPELLNGRYTIDPDGVGDETEDPCPVYCDMENHGGGWTLVASSRGSTLDDKDAICYASLATDRPTSGNAGVWNGMRALTDLAEPGDIRFSCRRDPTDASFEVDMAFYDCDWYQTITTGTDSASALNLESDPPIPPARENLLEEDPPEIWEAGDAWGEGDLVSEEAFDDLTSFVIDLNGPGIDSVSPDPDPLTTTSWGEVRGVRQCGSVAVSNGVWLIWVREIP